MNFRMMHSMRYGLLLLQSDFFNLQSTLNLLPFRHI
jgi:hypothetical protein